MFINKIEMFKAMDAKQWTFKDVAEKSGVSKVTLSAVYHGKRCRRDTAQKIADALGVAIEAITR